MKHNKKRLLVALTAGFLTITPAMLSGMMTATAAGTATLTITDTDSIEHDYKAYPIIKGTLSGTKLTALSWGDGIDVSDLVDGLNDDDNRAKLGIISAKLTGTPTPDDVAEYISGISSDKYQDLAKIISGCLDDNFNAIDLSKNGSSYSAGSLDYGWYLILDESTPLGTGNDSNVKVRSANILKLTGDVSINSKHSLPTLTKSIVDSTGANPAKANAASIGDIVYYDIETAVPDLTGYDKYFFIVNDTLSSGLTYNGDISITVNSTPPVTLSKDNDGYYTNESGDYYVTASADDASNGTNIKVVFEDVVSKFSNYDAGTPIHIKYSATLNNNAVIGSNGNPNVATLTYSNDPNETATGTPADTTNNEPEKPDEPNPNPSVDNPIGETPPSTVKTYTTKITIDKVDKNNHNTKLDGVTFRISGTALKSVVNETGLYVKDPDANPAYYLLKNGTYTTDAPGTPLPNTYLSNEKYAYTETNSISGTSVKVDTYGITTNGGELEFSGLGEGTYYITEVSTLEGYNLLTEPIVVVIGATINNNDGTCTWSYNSENSQTIQIENAQGSTLPTTGGIGTKLFYIFGGLLVTGSVVILVTKKRLSGREN